MLKIALTGGVGSGKSLACFYIEQNGYNVIYADKMAREITAPGGKAIPYIRQHFGDQYILPDGSMDRKKMRNLVYNNPDAMAVLKAGTTDVVISDVEEIVRVSEERGVKALFFEIPLLFESGSQKDYDQVWVITADIDTRIARVMERDGFTREEVLNVIKNQISEQKRLDLADEVIYNDGVAEELEQQIEKLLIKNNLK
ncbi:MAG: dephospho-CoA kinase [Clostridiales bacterium]|nr:dephospho-CoA kinase [Candidatus Crickella merdequi]